MYICNSICITDLSSIRKTHVKTNNQSNKSTKPKQHHQTKTKQTNQPPPQKKISMVLHAGKVNTMKEERHKSLELTGHPCFINQQAQGIV
jgi:hypothetical protein